MKQKVLRILRIAAPKMKVPKTKALGMRIPKAAVRTRAILMGIPKERRTPILNRKTERPARRTKKTSRMSQTGSRDSRKRRTRIRMIPGRMTQMTR